MDLRLNRLVPLLAASLLILVAFLPHAKASDAAVAPESDAASQSALHLTFWRKSNFINEVTHWRHAASGRVGEVQREPWRQLLRWHFVSKDAAGTTVAEAFQPWTAGVILPGYERLYISRFTGPEMVKLMGRSFVDMGGTYDVLGEKDHRLMKVRVSSDGQIVSFRRGDVGEFERVDCAEFQFDRTDSAYADLRISDRCNISEEAWILLGAFFSTWTDRMFTREILSHF